MSTKVQHVYFNFNEIREILEAHNEANNIKSQYADKQPLYAVAVASNSNFTKEYSLEARSYRFRSDNKAFISGLLGNSIFCDSLDGSDTGVRLDWYLYEWAFEYFYIEGVEE